MPLYITSPEADRLARALAAQTGETLTEAITAALRERLERTGEPSFERRLANAMEISKQAAALLGDRKFDADDIYDEQGLPR